MRFAFLSRVAADLCAEDGAWASWPVDVLHANDWPTGLAPGYASRLSGRRPSSVFTIHNLAFQGQFDVNRSAKLELPSDRMNVDGVLHLEQVSMLKAGLRFADSITTVSPTYAREIQTPELGFGMDGMLRLRAASLEGILNGVDARVWNPRTDTFLPSRYASGQWQAKSADKAALQKTLGLKEDPTAMLFDVVSRLTAKGDRSRPQLYRRTRRARCAARRPRPWRW